MAEQQSRDMDFSDLTHTLGSPQKYITGAAQKTSTAVLSSIVACVGDGISEVKAVSFGYCEERKLSLGCVDTGS